MIQSFDVTLALDILVYLLTVLSWMALSLIITYSYMRKTWRYIYMIIWFSLQTAWFTVNTILRIFYGYHSPTAMMSFWRLVNDANGVLSLIIVFSYFLYRDYRKQ